MWKKKMNVEEETKNRSQKLKNTEEEKKTTKKTSTITKTVTTTTTAATAKTTTTATETTTAAAYNAVGHEVVPLELPALVLASVEVLHLGDVVLQLHGKTHCYPVTAACPRPCVQDLQVDGVCGKGGGNWLVER